MPFEYVRDTVKPERDKNRREVRQRYWWRLGESGAALKEAVARLERFICTPRVAKHRLFVWMDPKTLPDSAVVAIAASDDYTFGVLHSRLHEVWSLAMGTRLGVGNDPRYTPTTCFETFAFPQSSASATEAIAAAAAHLDAVRRHILGQDARLTMTKLYNEAEELKERRNATAQAFPLLLAHEALDEAVAAAYGWSWPMSDDEILGNLLALNLERAG